MRFRSDVPTVACAVGEVTVEAGGMTPNGIEVILSLPYSDGAAEYDEHARLSPLEVARLIEVLQPFAAPRCSANGCGRLRGDGGPVCMSSCFQVRR